METIKIKSHEGLVALLVGFALIVSVNFIATPAFAAEKCLSQFPDSAWAKGEPPEVRSLLNRDLIRTKREVIRIPDQVKLPTMRVSQSEEEVILEFINNTLINYIPKEGYKEASYPVIVKYEYQGASCLIRAVDVEGGSVAYKPYKWISFKEKEEVRKFFEEQYISLNFLEIQKLVDQVGSLSDFFESTNSSPIKVSAAQSSKNNASLNHSLGLEDKFPFIGTLSLNFTSPDGCLTYPPDQLDSINSIYKKSSDIDKSFASLSFLGNSRFFTILGNKRVCQLGVFTSIPQSSQARLAKKIPTNLFGYVWVQIIPATSSKSGSANSQLNSKKVITCSKGKLEKKVSGASPKCPSGYKIKK